MLGTLPLAGFTKPWRHSMHCDYRDIRDRLGEPKWWDEAAVPRYCEFYPDRTHSIYARAAVLLRIACQGCGQNFLVSIVETSMDGRGALEQAVRNGDIHYGDPPNVGCCSMGGPTMNCEDLEVIEFWDRKPFETPEWIRREDLEGELPPFDWRAIWLR